MSGPHTTTADAAVVCLRVLRRLLQDEEATLAQLSYLMENLHDPLAHACMPARQRPVVAPTPPLSSVSTAGVVNRFGSPGKYAHASESSPAAAAASDDGARQRVPPQPAVVVVVTQQQQQQQQQQVATPAKGGKAAARTGKKGGGGATAATATATATAPRAPLTFSQYWDLFANLPTLYAVHLTLVQQLDAIHQRLLHIVGELYPGGRDNAVDHDAPAGGATLVEDLLGRAPQSSQTAPASDTGVNSQIYARKHVSALRHTPVCPATGTRSVWQDIGAMVCEFFGSELMKHFMAEHMMYTVKYTQRAAPQLLRLSRLWRWGVEGAPSSSPPASLAHLAEADRQALVQCDLFLDFLWRSFGSTGKPADSRVRLAPSPELRRSDSAEGGGPTPAPSPTEATGGGGGGGGPRRSRPTSAAAPPATALPPIPAAWEGFRTLLELLATPLGILRRYSHVARCLVESGALLPKDRQRLQSCFVDVAALRISEETNLVMEELSLRDVAGIMALMDLPGARSPLVPGRSSGGGALAAGAAMNSGGAVGVAVHNGHMAAEGGFFGNVSGATPAGAVAAAAAPADHGSRALIHYGRLLKRFGRGRHERLTFLFSDWMCYVEECANGRFRVRGTVPLLDLRVVEVRDDASLDTVNCFELTSPHMPKRIIFYAASPEQRCQWVDAIRYTARRFCAQQRDVANGAVRKTSTSAVTTGDGDVPSVMRSTAPMLMPSSRLSRQRRYDGVWQEYVDLQRRMAEVAPQAPHLFPSAAVVSAASPSTMGGALPSFASSTCHSPPPPNNGPSSDPSRDGSFAGQRSSSTHRQMDYDVTPWSQRASMHRRIRSQELITALQHQQQQQQQLAAPSPNCVTPTHPAPAQAGSNAELDSPVVPPLGSDIIDILSPVGSAGKRVPSPVPSSLHPQHQQQPQQMSLRLLSPVTVAVGVLSGRRSSGSLRPTTVEGMSSTGRGIAGGVGTPLRRPVSERFEAVAFSSSGGGGSLGHHQRTSSTPLHGSLISQREQPQLPESSSLPESATRRTRGSRDGGGGAHVPPLSPSAKPNHGAAEESADDKIILEDSTTVGSESDVEDNSLCHTAAAPPATAAAAVPSSLSREAFYHTGEHSKESDQSSDTASSGILDAIMAAPEHPSASPSHAAHESGAARAVRWSKPSPGPPSSGVAVAIRAPSGLCGAAADGEDKEGNDAGSRDTPAAAAAADRSVSVTISAGPPEQSVTNAAEEDDSATATATVTAFRLSENEQHRLLAPSSPVDILDGTVASTAALLDSSTR
ncbi:PH domain containing protein [Novymonas esmeraldas]|uniref:PH domain containing protein n=1 Tax=Novymonas esmeraldas TaxID=1808958 RepID=A0AAW0ETP0_9TRYP